MVLGMKLKIFIGTVGMMRAKKLIVFMVQLAGSWVQLARKVKISWVIVIVWVLQVRGHRSWIIVK